MEFLKKSTFIRLLNILLLLSFISCSDLESEPEDNIPVREGASCALELDEFANFFQTNLGGQITCLRSQLKKFMNAAAAQGRADRRGYLSLKSLKEYLEQSEPEYDQDLDDLITAFFKISYLIIGGDEDYISPQGVDRLTDFLAFLNKELVKVYEIIVPCNTTNEDEKCENEEVTYFRHLKNREQISDALVNIKAEIAATEIVNQSSLRFLKLKDLIELFETDENSQSIKKVLSVLFVKKALVGGDKDSLTNKQLFDPENESSSIIGKILQLGLLSFDAYKSPKIIFSNHLERMVFYEQMVESLKQNLYQTPTGSSVIATIPEITKAVDLIAPDFIGEGVKMAEFKESIVELKDIFMEDANAQTASDENFTFDNLNQGIDFGLDVLKMGVYFNTEYIKNADVLNARDPISQDLVECFRISNSSMEYNYCQRFNRIARNYRYYGGDFKLPYFDDGIYRNQDNASGMFEIGLIEKVLEKAFVFYDDDDTDAAIPRSGEKDFRDEVNRDKKVENYTLYLRQIRAILKKHYALLTELGVVVPGRIFGREDIASSDNVVLMSSLFQNQSNGTVAGDKAYVEVFEFTELAITLLSAIELKDFFSDEMLKRCSGDLIDGRVSPNCFRENFKIVLNTRIPGTYKSIADYMPKLDNYLEKLSESKLKEYVKESEKFTKMCMEFSLTPEEFAQALEGVNPYGISYKKTQGEEIPLSKTDMFAVFAGLFNVESTINRFDINGDNEMNPNEIDNAFNEVYQGVLRNVAKVEKTWIARKVFYYMIKKEKPPETIFEKVAMLTTKNKRSATRKKVAAILTAIGEKSDSNSPDNKCYNPYCCDAFRQVIDNETGEPRDLRKDEFDKIIKACRVKFKKDNYEYPYGVCERI